MPESTGRYKWFRDATRYYINAISKSSGKWATLFPSTKIEIGDYGVVDDETDEFVRRGNILKDDEILGIIPGLATDDLWKTSEEDTLVITYNMEMTDLGPNENADVRLEFKESEQFLVMYRPRTVDIPQPVNLAKLSKIQKLNGMRLVTGVVTCSAYALFYWSPDSSNDGVSISLNCSSPDTSANSLVKQGWTWGVDGIYKDGYNSEGDRDYTPLFSLTKTISYNPGDGKDASGQAVHLVDPIKPRLPIPPPSAGDGNEIFKSDEIGVAPWLSGKSKRPEKWKNRPSAPSDPAGNSANNGESIKMDYFSASEHLSTTAFNSSTRSGQAVGAADQTRVFHSRMPEYDSNDCFLSWCCCKKFSSQAK